MTIRDRVTGVPIGPKFPTRVIACSAQTTACAFPDADGLGAYLRVAALPGPTILHVVVLGYVVNVTPIPSVPVEPSGVSVAVVVNVTPLGVVRIVPAVNGGDPTVGGNVSRSWWTEYNPSVTNVSGAAVCSLEGIRVGVMTVTGLMPGVCAPAVLDRFGGPVLLLGPPLRDYVALGDFTGVAPMFGNSTWVNLTADRVTDAGYLNFTPGAYVTGFVYSGNGFSPPGQYSVTACSTDADQICGPPFPALVGGGLTQANSTLLGCDTSPGAFCVAAPPGPVKIVANGPGGATNWTWAEIPEAGRAT
ncbi:MAG TPA: hypothetical protein VGV64_08475, partial [Thermoplasmata archaeon]|nr:hypothetical protein [Thermoplasmata archaeon]